MLKQILKMNNAQKFYLEQEIIRLGAKQPGCVVSVFSETASCRVDLFLALADYF